MIVAVEWVLEMEKTKILPISIFVGVRMKNIPKGDTIFWVHDTYRV